MPNTLAHIGVQVLASRALVSRDEIKWVMAGCVVPDVPWIVQRAAHVLAPGIDRVDLRMYCVAQSSLCASLLLCAALASLASRPARVFAILAANALVHLLLDGLQTKLGNGVHLFAPLSWRLWNAGLFWPEDWPTWAITALGAFVLAHVIVRPAAGPRGVAPGARRVASCAVFVALWLALPAAWIDDTYAANCHDARALALGAPGSTVAIDRATCRAREDGRGRVLEHWAGTFTLAGDEPCVARKLSLSAQFTHARALSPAFVHGHWFPRDQATWIGLAGIAVMWLAAARVRLRPR
jgi:hypothetical protein